MGDLCVQTCVACSHCTGTGVVDHEECPTCGGMGDDLSYRRHTPSDLLTDPRVRALVEAAGTVVQYGEIAGDVYRDDLIAALAPFEVSDVG